MPRRSTRRKGLAYSKAPSYILARVTYLRFHLIFNLPVLILLAALTWTVPWSADELKALGIVLFAVVLFTAPWDNLAAKWGIWGFPREKYCFRIGYLPVEEYAFFVLQSVNVMLAVRALFHFFPDWLIGQKTDVGAATLICLAASIIPWTFITFRFRSLRRTAGPRVNYAIHLAWFLPVIYTQWLLAPSLFWGHASLLLLLTASFGAYYTLADVFAVRSGTWYFDEKQITGAKLGGILPWEEIAFFFLTSLLVAQSYLLLLASELR